MNLTNGSGIVGQWTYCANADAADYYSKTAFGHWGFSPKDYDYPEIKLEITEDETRFHFLNIKSTTDSTTEKVHIFFPNGLLDKIFLFANVHSS